MIFNNSSNFDRIVSVLNKKYCSNFLNGYFLTVLGTTEIISYFDHVRNLFFLIWIGTFFFFIPSIFLQYFQRYTHTHIHIPKYTERWRHRQQSEFSFFKSHVCSKYGDGIHFTANTFTFTVIKYGGIYFNFKIILIIVVTREIICWVLISVDKNDIQSISYMLIRFLHHTVRLFINLED